MSLLLKNNELGGSDIIKKYRRIVWLPLSNWQIHTKELKVYKNWKDQKMSKRSQVSQVSYMKHIKDRNLYRTFNKIPICIPDKVSYKEHVTSYYK